MPLVIPASRNYQSQLTPIPDAWMNQNPPEGPQQIPAEIIWATMAGSGQCMSFNIRGNAAQTISQIRALSVDNSQCGSDVVFIFTDVNDTITIPAYSPKIIVPVFSNGTTFFVQATGEVLTADVTRFALHNTLPPPLAIPVTQAQTAVIVGALEMDGAAVTNITATTATGTLKNGNMSFSANIVGGGNYMATAQLEDGSGKILAKVTWSGDPGDEVVENALVWNVQDIAVRFKQGLKIRQGIVYGSVPSTQLYLNANLYYRTP